MRLTGLINAVVVAATAFSLTGNTQAHASSRHFRSHHRHVAAAPHVLQCVAFARSASDVALTGNAVNWWQNARGIYARGTAPEVGSVLNFRANSRMRLGHVAVVTQIVDSRTIQIDQSHWHANGISRDVSVIDVSQNNDWSAVRVAIGHRGTFGSIYPTYGFIYPRPDTSGRIVTARSDAAMPHSGNISPADLRSSDAEVAEVPDSAAGLDLAPGPISDDAPNRSLR
jgi:surface antigen